MAWRDNSRISLRIRLKYPDIDTFVRKYAPNVSRGGMFIQSRRPQPVGTEINFELLLRDGSELLRGWGRVVWVKAYDELAPDEPHGMGVRFAELDGNSAQIIEQIIAFKEGALAETQVERSLTHEVHAIDGAVGGIELDGQIDPALLDVTSSADSQTEVELRRPESDESAELNGEARPDVAPRDDKATDQRFAAAPTTAPDNRPPRTDPRDALLDDMIALERIDPRRIQAVRQAALGADVSELDSLPAPNPRATERALALLGRPWRAAPYDSVERTNPGLGPEEPAPTAPPSEASGSPRPATTVQPADELVGDPWQQRQLDSDDSLPIEAISTAVDDLLVDSDAPPFDPEDAPTNHFGSAGHPPAPPYRGEPIMRTVALPSSVDVSLESMEGETTGETELPIDAADRDHFIDDESLSEDDDVFAALADPPDPESEAAEDHTRVDHQVPADFATSGDALEDTQADDELKRSESDEEDDTDADGTPRTKRPKSGLFRRLFTRGK
ncbi:MAG: TIGR02266 family protein [Deltaproteobacteria bacterium]|nr:TIGR02266 family protein [Deltaproteobacteria bacterium]